jgi:hypothetical protein
MPLPFFVTFVWQMGCSLIVSHHSLPKVVWMHIVYGYLNSKICFHNVKVNLD